MTQMHARSTWGAARNITASVTRPGWNRHMCTSKPCDQSPADSLSVDCQNLFLEDCQTATILWVSYRYTYWTGQSGGLQLQHGAHAGRIYVPASPPYCLPSFYLVPSSLSQASRLRLVNHLALSCLSSLSSLPDHLTSSALQTCSIVLVLHPLAPSMVLR